MRAEVAALPRPYSRWTWLGLRLGVLLVLVVLPQLLTSQYHQSVLVRVLIFAILAMSLDLLLGYTGLASMGHAAFFGLGAYTAGIISLRLSSELAITLPASVLVAGVGALVVGFLSIRTAGVYFLMLTLAFAQVVYALAFKLTSVTRGSDGLSGIPRPSIALLGIHFDDFASLYYLVLVIFVASYLLLERLVHSPFGHALIGIKENESRMRAIGYNTFAHKLVSFVVGGLFAGVAGALYAYFNGFVAPSDVYWTVSGLALVMVIIGGAGTLIGPVMGAAVVLLLETIVASATERWLLIMGLVFIVMVLFARRGLAGSLEDAATLLRRAVWKS